MSAGANREQACRHGRQVEEESSSVHASKFTGKIQWVQLDVGVDDNDHFISPEERLRIAMARQWPARTPSALAWGYASVRHVVYLVFRFHRGVRLGQPTHNGWQTTRLAQ
jgi:hypothetical protein